MSEAQEVEKTEKPVVSSPKKNKKHLRLSWWLVVLAVLVFGAVAWIISSATKNQTELPAKVDTAEEIKIKQTLSSLRGDIVRYFEEKNTYVDWQPTNNVSTRIAGFGSEIKIKTSKDAYMIYAKMPSSKVTFCMDSTGFTSEVKSVNALQKACK